MTGKINKILEETNVDELGGEVLYFQRYIAESRCNILLVTMRTHNDQIFTFVSKFNNMDGVSKYRQKRMYLQLQRGEIL